MSYRTSATLEETLRELGEPAYRRRQIEEAKRAGAEGFGDVSTLPASLRTRLAELVPFWSMASEREARSADGTLKWVVRAPDGVAVETVLIAHAAGRRTVCLSSQAGCALACRFCATGAMGPGRDLSGDEIFDQAILAQRRARETGGRLTNAVFMGMGEPLQNLDAVLDATDRINAPEGLGISARRIAISTVGWVPGITRLTHTDTKARLAISLHASDDDTRSELMPINVRYPIANLLAECRRYCDTTGRRVFIEYLLLDRVNDEPADARRLAALLRDGRFHVNLIEYNPTAGPYRASPEDRRDAFRRALSRGGIEASVRHSRGADVAAACGQLALGSNERGAEPPEAEQAGKPSVK